LRDLAPVGIVSSIAQVVIAKKDLPAKTLAELVPYAKVSRQAQLRLQRSRRPDPLLGRAVPGPGIKVVHIPFKGGAPRRPRWSPARSISPSPT
jgi:tripartite-type tricarboxylate transporter receptor subunit TctC